ncbi:DNA-binding transcriptional regulator, LysR family [Allopseudospirillum japonicum]|uniref:DNA-binding transcriptional regulator, LysR family n=1 Tax=Allopseudospirillum japonicum TaxID=64971 RepID=A0A1H6RXL5_9GAMM|nr:LysR substrate-binding domain-containing protein [Allopseudospirillum japonicum]SEI55932.1 DNA-binding transcriptional regulator, LysR family [Allopseudospirillum japonicum]
MPTTPITLEALQVLDAIARRGSFAAAASELDKVPSAISYTVRKLEQELGIDLFNRDGHRATLTPAGQLTLEQGRRILEAADELTYAARQLAQGWEQKLHIYYNTYFSIESLLPLLKAFRAQHAHVELSVQEATGTQCWDALLTEQADLILGAPQVTVLDSRVITLELGQLDFGLFAAPQHPLAQDPQASLIAYDCMSLDKQVPTAIENQLSAQVRLPNANAQIAALCAGLGWGWLPWTQAQAYVQRGDLVALAQMAPLTQQILAAWRRPQQGKALSWWVETLTQQATKHAASAA